MREKQIENLLATLTIGCGLAAIATLSTGCSYPTAFEDGSHGRITLSADAAGMRAYGDSLNALITNGKASADKDTSAWRNRREEEQEITTREVAKIRTPKNLLSNFFGVSSNEQNLDGDNK